MSRRILRRLAFLVAIAFLATTFTVVESASAASGISKKEGVWYYLAKCESGNKNVNTGNGYYGYFQFSKATWKGIGGTGYPHKASKAKQLKMAKKLQKKYGWGQWSCSGKARKAAAKAAKK